MWPSRAAETAWHTAARLAANARRLPHATGEASSLPIQRKFNLNNLKRDLQMRWLGARL
jgi:hypothetical protein